MKSKVLPSDLILPRMVLSAGSKSASDRSGITSALSEELPPYEWKSPKIKKNSKSLCSTAPRADSQKMIAM